MKRLNIPQIIGGLVVIVGTWYIISLAPQPIDSALVGVRLFFAVFGFIMILHGLLFSTIKSKDGEGE